MAALTQFKIFFINLRLTEPPGVASSEIHRLSRQTTIHEVFLAAFTASKAVLSLPVDLFILTLEILDPHTLTLTFTLAIFLVLSLSAFLLVIRLIILRRVIRALFQISAHFLHWLLILVNLLAVNICIFLRNLVTFRVLCFFLFLAVHVRLAVHNLILLYELLKMFIDHFARQEATDVSLDFDNRHKGSFVNLEADLLFGVFIDVAVLLSFGLGVAFFFLFLVFLIVVLLALDILVFFI